jgi:hypothetical protein
MTYSRLSAVYGLSFDDLSGMPLAAITAYIECIPAVLAERRLIAADGATVPHLKHPRQALAIWTKMAYGEAARARKATPGELMLMGIGIKRTSDVNKPG